MAEQKKHRDNVLSTVRIEYKAVVNTVNSLSQLNITVQMYLNTGQCECCYPAWDSLAPNYTILISQLNATSMPDLWSNMVRLFLNCNSSCDIWLNPTLLATLCRDGWTQCHAYCRERYSGCVDLSSSLS